jgi:cobalt/nickel transport system ATP-binding protein
MPMVSELFERTVIMEGGKVVASGCTCELLADQALLRRHGLEL